MSKRSKIAAAIAAIMMVLAPALQLAHSEMVAAEKASDAYLKQRIVQLKSPIGRGSCSGVQVKAPSGKAFIVSAAHCEVLMDAGRIKVEASDDREAYLRVLYIDDMSDLMILEALDDKTIDVAEATRLGQKVHSITHGAGLPAYRTDGVLIAERPGMFIKSQIQIDEDIKACKSRRNQSVEMTQFGQVCVVTIVSITSTLFVASGSSGGAILDEAGKLAGIVTGIDGYGYSLLVPLRDIQRVLSGL